MEAVPTALVDEQALRRVTWAVRRADLALQAAKEPDLRAVDVPGAHYALLITVHTHPGLAGAELSRLLGVTPQAVALLAGKLTARGLLQRRPHPRHRNIVEFHLTDAGLDALREADAVTARLEQRILTTLGPDRHAQLRTLLDELIVALALPGPTR